MADLTDNQALSRFETTEQGHTVFADYRRQGARVIIDHVEAPDELKGTGAAGRFMEALVETARTHGWKLVPHCSYATTWLQRHPAEAEGVVE